MQSNLLKRLDYWTKRYEAINAEIARRQNKTTEPASILNVPARAASAAAEAAVNVANAAADVASGVVGTAANAAGNVANDAGAVVASVVNSVINPRQQQALAQLQEVQRQTEIRNAKRKALAQLREVERQAQMRNAERRAAAAAVAEGPVAAVANAVGDAAASVANVALNVASARRGQSLPTPRQLMGFELNVGKRNKFLADLAYQMEIVAQKRIQVDEKIAEYDLKNDLKSKRRSQYEYKREVIDEYLEAMQNLQVAIEEEEPVQVQREAAQELSLIQRVYEALFGAGR